MNKNLTLFILLYLLVINSLVGQDIKGVIQTIPENTMIYDSLKKELGKLPENSNVFKYNTFFQIAAKGFDPIILKFGCQNGVFNFPDNLVECHPCLFEYNNSPLTPNFKPAGKLRLRKKIAEHRNQIMIGVMPPTTTISDKEIVANINGKSIKLGNEDIHLTLGYFQNLTFPIISGLNDSYLVASDFGSNNAEKTGLYMPKIVVKPIIKKLEYKLEGKTIRKLKGYESIICEWQFFSTLDTSKILGKTTTSVELYRSLDNANLPVQDLVFESGKELLINDTLYTFLEKVEKDLIKLSIKNPIPLKKIEEKKFENQREMLKTINQRVVTIENSVGFGSGVIIDPSGIILTNHHVIIEDTTDLKVRVQGFEELIPASVFILNSEFDLALIKLPPGNYNAILPNLNDSLEIGDMVFGIGTPIDRSLGQSVTKGIVSGFRKWNGLNFIQTDIAVNSGNSGGPLINETGKFVGLITMKAYGKGIEGLGFCIPSATIVNALNLTY
jgi:serine protease Do